jgi:hypothetical protein
MARPGAKGEGDGRTPSGTFGFGFFFGVDPDPGVRFRYRRIDASDFWDDAPSSPLSNEWVDDRDHGGTDDGQVACGALGRIRGTLPGGGISLVLEFLLKLAELSGQFGGAGGIGQGICVMFRLLVAE